MRRTTASLSKNLYLLLTAPKGDCPCRRQYDQQNVGNAYIFAGSKRDPAKLILVRIKLVSSCHTHDEWSKRVHYLDSSGVCLNYIG